MKLTLKTITQDNLSAIRLEMIKHYFSDTFRTGHYRYIRDNVNMAKTLEISNLSEGQLKTILDLVPKLWPGVKWAIEIHYPKLKKAPTPKL